MTAQRAFIAALLSLVLLYLAGQLRSVIADAATLPVYENPKQSDPTLELARLRNEGIAQFESGIGLKKALAAFEAASQLRQNSAVEFFNLATTQRKLGNTEKSLELLNRAAAIDPGLAQVPYTLGLLNRTRGDTAAAVTAFEAARAKASAEPSIHYQLGRLYRELKREPEALQSFVNALQLDPQHTGAMYQLFLYYQEHGEADRAKAMFDEFSRIKRALSLTRKELNDDESWLTRPIATDLNGVRPQQQAPALRWTVTAVPAVKHAGAIVVKDFDLDGLDDLVVGTANGTVSTYHNEGARGFAPGPSLQLPTREPIIAMSVEILIREQGYRIIAATKSALFVAQQDITIVGGKVTRIGTGGASLITLADLDHDGDVDLVVDAFQAVWFNDGAGNFNHSDYLDAAARRALSPLTGPLVAVDILNRNGIDFIGVGRDGKRALIADNLGGKHASKPFDKIAGVNPVVSASAADLDNDGDLDLVTSSRGAIRVDYHKQQYQFMAGETLHAPDGAIVVGDFDNDGWKDFLALGSTDVMWLRNLGGRSFSAQSSSVPLGAVAIREAAVTDIDQDGRLDVVARLDSGEVRILQNATTGIGKSVRVSLQGLRSAPSGLHSVVELRRGTLYEKYVSSGGALDLPLGEGNYAEILRINWPNGFVESKLRVAAGKPWQFKESERVSGSCPSVFAWDGGQFRFITDAFISGPMGVPFAAGHYFPVDHDEYLKIPGEVLRSADDVLRVAITEELREAVFLDRARLLAVDHPSDTEFFPNEYLHAGDFPVFKLHFSGTLRPPESAVDQAGRDVTEVVATADRRYPTSFARLQYEGLAEENFVEFILPGGAATAASLRVFLTGWFHYFESTSLIAVSQRQDLHVQWPQIEVMDQGSWRSVMEIGIPSGKDKTVVVDLSHRLPPDARRLRVRSNLALYWDRIAIDTGTPPHDVRLAELPTQSARLRFRGFSSFEPVPVSARPQPERFVYGAVHYQAPWNPLLGNYTRYGGVQPLLADVDSEMTVFGSGDELVLEFDARQLPPLKPGWRRDYLLHLDGFVKDGDKYTAYAGSLNPIPYAGMTAYPYEGTGPSTAVFSRPEYQSYQARYQTRTPLRFTGPDLSPRSR